MSLENIWRTWFIFRKGKNPTPELHEFQYHLEMNLMKIFRDLKNQTYHHGAYRKFIVSDNKRREISVAGVRDRLIHRLIYDHLVALVDKTFIFDAWSCRAEKGLLGAIKRAQSFLKSYSGGFVWRGDVQKFFESVHHETLLKILSLKVKNAATLHLLKEIINSFSAQENGEAGIPIGNLTSQIFANIYLNELDRFVKHDVKPQAYLRYGDDFLLVESSERKLKSQRDAAVRFLENTLKLKMNAKNDRILKAKEGVRFLGVVLWPKGHILNKRCLGRVFNRLERKNISSYGSLLKEHARSRHVKFFNGLVCGKLL